MLTYLSDIWVVHLSYTLSKRKVPRVLTFHLISSILSVPVSRYAFIRRWNLDMIRLAQTIYSNHICQITVRNIVCWSYVWHTVIHECVVAEPIHSLHSYMLVLDFNNTWRHFHCYN